jgi:hypothetical protein
MAVRVALAAFAFVASSATAAPSPAAAPAEWRFTVLLDGRPVGQHQFNVSTRVDGTDIERTVESEADFTVRFMGMAVYRYRLRFSEQWQGDCLSALTATTDDDGKTSGVRAERESASVRIVRTAPARGGQPVVTQVDGACVMSYAYWNPALRTQTRLLNPDSGRIDPVAIEPIADTSVDVRGEAVQARGWRIGGLPHAIDVWYAADGAWIGLDTVVDGGRRLSYRLR